MLDLPQDEAARFNSGKTQYHLVPKELLDWVAGVFNYGATKYAPNNWKLGGDLETPYNSLMRHLLAWLDGEEEDWESSQHHMAHVMWNAFCILYWLTHGTVKTDFRMATPEFGAAQRDEAIDVALNRIGWSIETSTDPATGVKTSIITDENGAVVERRWPPRRP